MGLGTLSGQSWFRSRHAQAGGQVNDLGTLTRDTCMSRRHIPVTVTELETELLGRKPCLFAKHSERGMKREMQAYRV